MRASLPAAAVGNRPAGGKAKRIGIVGGGLGGMMSALLLARDGHRVTLFERSSRLGGRLRYEEFGGRFRIDQGPTIVLLPDMLLGLLRAAGVDTDRLQLVRCDPMYRIHYADGTRLEKWSDPSRQEVELLRSFPGEEKGFRAYMRDMAFSYERGKPAFLEKPFLRASDFFTWRNLRLLHRMQAYRGVRSHAARYFRNPKLVDAFSLQTLYIGGAPQRTPALYSLIPYAEHAFGIWYVKGGYAGLVPLIGEALQKHGVEIRLSAEVLGLEAADGRCSGLYTAKGAERFDAVVYNGDYPHLKSMLPKEPGGANKEYQPSSGCLLVYLGLNRRWEDAPAHQFFLPPSLERSLREIFGEERLPAEPSFYVFNPAALDEEAAPPGESVLYMLIPVPPASADVWRNDAARKAERLADLVLAEAESRGFPGLREAVVARSVRTPLQAQASGLYGGGSFGIAPTLGQSGYFRPQVKPLPMEGLYAVGASVHPGGGVPIVMQGAKLLAEEIRKGLR